LFVLLFGSTATLGQTSFAPAQDFPYLYNPNLYYLPIMYSADVDADNKKDVIILDDNGIVWYKNEGNGNFSDGTQIVDFAQYSKMFPNDIDQDGDIDLVGANSFDGNVDYYANDGSGNFSDAQTIFVVDNEPPLSFEPEFVHINMTDFDNDGDDDVVYHQITNGILTWRPNNGNGNFSEEFPIDTISSWLNIPIIIIDFDNNGSKDIIAILSSEGLTYVYTNDGSGNFTEVQLNNSNLLSINADAKILTIDINNDGREDIVMSNLGDNLLWFENQGNGNFGSAQIIENGNLGATSFDLIAADIDNDGDADLVSLGSLYTDDAVFPFQTISWHENNDGSFNQHLIDIMLLFLAPIENPYYNYNDLFLVEDFDNDGDFDVLSYIFDDM
ncbi:MAG TPA: VCBS repeat-containing protein, partial [Chitinophagales bacterium]|nr:VCBS repeat-containing protein [Chitinophagales bacterium]